MRGLIFGIAGLLLLASPGFCQVDTLMLVEIGQIEAPAEIADLYVEDLDGDSLKEIILTTATNIHIYNGITYEEIWTSPDLVNPEDLLFEDINNDGPIDFSVRDSLNITLFDPLNSATIWTSPPIDSTYSCYTLGDRNDDDWIDVAIVSKEAFTRPHDPENQDTVWVKLFDGPAYSQQSEFHILMQNHSCHQDDFYWSLDQYPIYIDIKRISGENDIQTLLFLFSYTNRAESFHQSASRWYSGNLWVVKGDGSIEQQVEGIGKYLTNKIIMEDNIVYMYSLNHYAYRYSWDVSYRHWDIEKYVNKISADTLLDSDTIWNSSVDWSPYPIEWDGFAIGEINWDSPEIELTFGGQDSLYLFSFPSLDLLWLVDNVSNLESLSSIFWAVSIFDNPQVLCEIGDPLMEYRFYNGSDGSLSAILPAYEYGIAHVADLDSDGNDEIFSIDEGILHIYGLQRTAIDDKPVTPNLPYLLSNYPNPFNSSTIIEYGLPQAGHVTIEIYDPLGRKVEMLVDEEEEAGTYQVVWDAGNRSSGVYFYRITAGDLAETRRMVLLK